MPHRSPTTINSKKTATSVTSLQMLNSKSRPPRNMNAALLVFGVALLVQVVVLSRLAASHHLVPQGDDMKFYLDWGTRIAGGQWTDGKAFYGLPGYAYWLAATMLIAGGSSVGTCLLTGGIQAVAFAGLASLIFLLTRDALRSCNLQRSRRAILEAESRVGGGVAALGWILFTPAQAFSAVLMPTVGLVLVYWACVRILSKADRDTPLWAWLLIGAIVGLCAMFVATILFLLPLAVFAILKAVRNDSSLHPMRKGFLTFAVLVVGVASGASPAWVHNSLVAREPVVLSAHGGINLWIGNNPEANGYPKIPHGLRRNQEQLLKDSLSLPEKTTGREMSRSEVSRFWTAKAKGWIVEHPAEWHALLRTKFENFWNAFQYDDVNVLKLLRSEKISFGYTSFGLLSALGLAGMAWGAWPASYSRWVLAAILLHMLALVPVFVTERYRLAAVPGLLVCAVLGLWLLWRSLNSGQWVPAALYLSAVIGSTAFASMPKGSPEAWALSHYSIGVRALSAAESARSAKDAGAEREAMVKAERELQLAYRHAPASGEINFALGNLSLMQEKRSSAKLFYSRVLELSSGHASALNNLGVIALQDEHWNLAASYFQAALRAEPKSAKAHYLLAKAKAKSGDLAGALAAIESAITLRPQQKEFLVLQEELKSHHP